MPVLPGIGLLPNSGAFVQLFSRFSIGCEPIKPEALANVRFRAHNGLNSDIVPSPEKCQDRKSRSAASLRKSSFAEAFDKHLRPPVTATGQPSRYSEIALKLKKLGRRLPGFCISP